MRLPLEMQPANGAALPMTACQRSPLICSEGGWPKTWASPSRGGLEVLLKGWGAQVASFETVEASQAWAQAADPISSRPDLLIVDYRLEQGRTGVEAIQALRQRFGSEVPAIMVTGSTMTGHEAEAQEHDFHLLVKPVVPNKLRAMISFKLGVRSPVPVAA
jgi:CheY-like chemotaxis protein